MRRRRGPWKLRVRVAGGGPASAYAVDRRVGRPRSVMPQFHWKGRTSGGQQVTGSLAAGSKEDVMSSLRRQGITVQSIEEKRGHDEEIDYEAGRRVPTTTAD